jgi:amidase
MQAILAFKGDDVFVAGLSNSKVRTVREHWKGNTERAEFNKMWYNEVWDKYGFDGIIAPVLATPALPHG